MIRQDMTKLKAREIDVRSAEKQARRRRNAFTLIELLVVVAIIVSLAGLGGFYFIGVLTDSKKSASRLQAKELEKAAEMYYVNEGDYPPNLAALMQVSPSGKAPLLKPDAALKDSFGAPFEGGATNGFYQVSSPNTR